MKIKHVILLAVVASAGFLAQTGASAAMFVTIGDPLSASTGLVTDRFDVGSNLNGLTYSDTDLSYGPTLFYSIRNDTAGNSTFTTISSLTSSTTARMSVGNHAFDAVTYAAPDVGYGATIFYSLSHDLAGNSTFGTIQPTGVPYTALFGVGLHFDVLTFSATDVGYGANLFYYLSHDSAGNSTFGTINPALPGTVTPRFTIPGMNFNGLVFTATDVGYGADMFYYLRTDTSGNSVFGTINATASFSGTRVDDRFELGAPFDELTFTTTDVGYGANLFYSLRSGTSIPEPALFWLGPFCACVFGAWQRLAARRRKAGRS